MGWQLGKRLTSQLNRFIIEGDKEMNILASILNTERNATDLVGQEILLHATVVIKNPWTFSQQEESTSWCECPWDPRTSSTWEIIPSLDKLQPRRGSWYASVLGFLNEETFYYELSIVPSNRPVKLTSSEYPSSLDFLYLPLNISNCRHLVLSGVHP